jgi:hypothetical protein
MSIEAMKLALDALEEAQTYTSCEAWSPSLTEELVEVAHKLRAAIEQAEKQEPVKLWLWKNFVNGRPEYWAFDNPYPTNLYDGDPQTLGQPCGYAIFKESRDGSRGRTEEQVLREMKNVAPPQREWQGLTDEEIKHIAAYQYQIAAYAWTGNFARAIEAKLKEKNT